MPDVEILMPWEVPGGEQQEQPKAQDQGVMMPWELEQEQPFAQQPQVPQPQIPEFARTRPQEQVTHERTQEKPGFLRSLVTGEGRFTEASEGVPEIQEFSTGSFATDLQAAAGLLFSATDEGKRQVIEEYFPGTKVWVDQKGTTIIEGLPKTEKHPEGRAVLNAPGWTIQDTLETANEMAMFYGPGKITELARVGKLAGVVGKKLAPATEKAIGATWQRRRTAEALMGAGVEAGRQKVAQEFQKEAVALDPSLIAQAGALEAVGGIGGDYLAGRQARKLEEATGLPEDIGKRSVQNIEEAIQLESEIPGLKLSKAGATMSPSAADEAYILARGEGSRGAFEDHLRALTKSREEYGERMLDALAPGDKATAAYRNLQKALADEKAARITSRDEWASELYGEARAFEGVIDTSQTLGQIDDMLKRQKSGSPVAVKLKKARRLIAPEEGVENTTEVLHDAKYNLDAMIEQASPTERRVLMGVKKQLLDELESQNPAYGVARETFARQSKPIQYLSEEIFGDIEKVAPQHMKRLRKIVFDAEELAINPEASKKLVRELDNINPELKHELLRQEMTTRISMVRTVGDEVPASKLLSSLYGSRAERNMFRSMMNEPQRKMYDNFEKALVRERFEYGALAGSPTAGREAAKGRIYKRGFGETMQNLIDSPKKSFAGKVADFWNGVSREDRERHLETVFVESFLDPKNAKTLELISKEAMTGKDVSKKFATYLTDIAKTSPQLAKYSTDTERQ